MKAETIQVVIEALMAQEQVFSDLSKTGTNKVIRDTAKAEHKKVLDAWNEVEQLRADGKLKSTSTNDEDIKPGYN